jgi:Mn2+/Fe2+ NRAMP family transporter
MGTLTNLRGTTVIAWCMACLIVALNGFLLYDTIAGAL